MTDIATNNRFAPPRADVQDLPFPIDDPQALAGRWARLGASVIDMLVYAAIYFAVLLPMYGNGALHSVDRAILPGIVIYYVLAYAAEAWFLYRSSQSIGKIALGIRIVRKDGGHASFARAFGLRTMLPAAIFMIPFFGAFAAVAECLFIFGPSRRCLHDFLADTIVVTTASASDHRAA